MLYTKNQLQSCLGSGEDFRGLTLYGHGGHLVHLCETICKYCQFPFSRRPCAKSGENWLSGFRLHNFIYVYSPNITTAGHQDGRQVITVAHPEPLVRKYEVRRVVLSDHLIL